MTTTITRTTEVTDVPKRMVELWAEHDADQFGDLFTDDGVMLLPGVLQVGRENIAEFMRQAYATVYAGSQVTGAPVAVRPLAEDAVVLVTDGGVIPAGHDSVPEEDQIRATWVLKRVADEWKVAVYQNGPKN